MDAKNPCHSCDTEKLECRNSSCCGECDHQFIPRGEKAMNQISQETARELLEAARLGAVVAKAEKEKEGRK